MGTFWAAVLLAATLVPAFGQGVTYQDLEGAVIEAKIVDLRRLRHEGGEPVENYSDKNYRLSIGPGNTIHQRVSFTWTSVNGRHLGGRVLSGTYTLGQPKKGIRGHNMFVFEGGRLTQLMTFDVGARRITYPFARTGSGLSCSVSAPFARETGRGNRVMDSIGVRPGKVEILSEKTVSTSCHVTKR